MATVTLIPTNVPFTASQTTKYACPAKACWVVSNAALEFSLDNTNFTLVAASTTGMTTSYPFMRCTTGDAIVSFKPLA